MRIKLIANGSLPWERWVRRWGLSLLIEEDILFDAFGDPRVFMGNLRRFRVDVGSIGQVVVSHEHWDHVDGLRPLLAQKPRLKIYLPHNADVALKDKLRHREGDVIEVDGPVGIGRGVRSTGQIGGRYAGRDMPEQALVLEARKGLIVVAGCAHPGIMTIVNHVKRSFRQPVHAVIGGFHLKDRSAEDISVEAARLKAAGVEIVVPLHCTGRRAEQVFRHVFGAGCLSMREGQDMEF